MKIILASASPRRRELLKQIGLEYEVLVSDAEEVVSSTVPAEVVEELARQKAENVYEKYNALHAADGSRHDEQQDESLLIISADTIVACDGQILGKPKDEEDAKTMLGMLQGRSHEVYTGVCFRYQSLAEEKERVHSFHEVTKVHFYPMTEQEIADYVGTGDPLDKAGAYGIQGLCARYISGIKGDYNNVVGLPVGRLYQEMKEFLAEAVTRKKAVIFDLDGTLSDSINSIKYCGDAALATVGYGPYDVEEYKYFVGDGAANLVKRALIAGGDTGLTRFDEAFAEYKKIFKENCMYEVRPYEGIRELLAALKDRGVKLAVLSNKPHAETINVVEALFGKGYFDVLQGQKDSVAIKPSPEGVFQILEQLNLQAEDILYLGDTATDMKTGKSAGAFTVGALWGFRKREELEENHADAIIVHPLELLKFL